MKYRAAYVCKSSISFDSVKRISCTFHFVLYISSFNFVLHRSIMDSDGKELISVVQWGCIGNRSIEKYTLKNKVGQEVDIITYGATITSIRIPDKYGNIADIVLGFDSIEGIS